MAKVVKLTASCQILCRQAPLICTDNPAQATHYCMVISASSSKQPKHGFSQQHAHRRSLSETYVCCQTVVLDKLEETTLHWQVVNVYVGWYLFVQLGIANLGSPKLDFPCSFLLL